MRKNVAIVCWVSMGICLLITGYLGYAIHNGGFTLVFVGIPLSIGGILIGLIGLLIYPWFPTS